MKKLFIVANWKSNMTNTDMSNWVNEIRTAAVDWEKHADKEVIVCPSYPYLPLLKKLLQEDAQLPIKIGSQNLSHFPKGAYTGEVYTDQIKDFADYVILGHSERRQNFGETDAILVKKREMAATVQLLPIFCVQGAETPIPADTAIVAYEPVFAIGSGHPDTPENANEVSKKIKEHTQYVLYGGSVSPENVHSFTQMEHIDGVLVGGASLDPKKFAQIIVNS